MRLRGMRDKRAVTLIACLALVAVSCGSDGAADPTSTTVRSSATTVAPTTTTSPPGTIAPTPTPADRYFVEGTLLDKEGVGPQLCNFVNTSLPPQCRGLPVSGVDWEAVPGAESAGDTRWATVRLVGTFDGSTLVLTEPPTAPLGIEPPYEAQDFTSPCPEPESGWTVRDPALADSADWNRARIYAEAQPEFAGLWVDQLLEPGERENEEHDAATFVANVTFTGDLDRHRSALEEIYGGPLCVSQGIRPLAELRAIQDTVFDVLSTPEAVEAGIHAGYGMGSSSNQFRGVVEAWVMIMTNPDAQAWVDEQFGPGLVEVRSYLQPVDSSGPPPEAAPLFPQQEALPIAVWVAGTTYDLSQVPAPVLWASSLRPPLLTPSGVVAVTNVDGAPSLVFFPSDGGEAATLAGGVDRFVVSADGSRVAWVEAYPEEIKDAREPSLLVEADLPSGEITHTAVFPGFDIEGLPTWGFTSVESYVGDAVLLMTGDAAVGTAAVWVPARDLIRRAHGYGVFAHSVPFGNQVMLSVEGGPPGVVVTVGPDGSVDPPDADLVLETIDGWENGSPTFSPDGSTIAFGDKDRDGGGPIVRLISTQGEDFMRMPIVGVPGLYWRVHGIAWTDELTILVLVESWTDRTSDADWSASWGIYQCDLDDLSGCHLQVSIDFEPTGRDQVALVQQPNQ